MHFSKLTFVYSKANGMEMSHRIYYQCLIEYVTHDAFIMTTYNISIKKYANAIAFQNQTGTFQPNQKTFIIERPVQQRNWHPRPSYKHTYSYKTVAMTIRLKCYELNVCTAIPVVYLNIFQALVSDIQIYCDSSINDTFAQSYCLNARPVTRKAKGVNVDWTMC